MAGSAGRGGGARRRGVRLYSREAGPDGGRSSHAAVPCSAAGCAASRRRVVGERCPCSMAGSGAAAGGAAPSDGVPSSPSPIIGGPPHPADSACSYPSATLLRAEHHPPQGLPRPLPHDSPRHRPTPGPGPAPDNSSRPPTPTGERPRRTHSAPYHHRY
ncbi:protein of unknown function [Streptomyces murinus]